MFRQIIIVLSCCYVLAGCEPSSTTSAVITAPKWADTEHSSRNALDWSGDYEGVLPCADCEGIRIRITLYADDRYQLQTEYLGENANQFQENGTFVWNYQGSKIRLQGDESGGNRQFMVGENKLFQLDQEGNLITGALESHYTLHKVRENGAADKQAGNVLTENRWYLVELMGAAIPPDTGIFLNFNPDFTVNGFAGCNQLAGQYQVQEYKLSLQQLAVTEKACMTETPENEFLRVLEQVDNYAVADNQLSLHKARMSPLARFSAREAEQD